MLNSEKNPQKAHPVTILSDAKKRAEPAQFALQSTDLIGLLKEAMELAKLKATEQRDLEVIRNDYMLKKQHLEEKHAQAMEMIQKSYADRKMIIDEISGIAKALIEAEQYEAGQAVVSQMLTIISKESPLQAIIEMNNKQRFT